MIKNNILSNKIVKISLIILPLFLFASFDKKTEGQNINLQCHSAVLIDQNSLRVLYNKNGNQRRPMASTTKIVTAMVALEKGNLKDVFVVSKKAARTTGSSANLSEGEKITLEELLYGLMLRSGNDAAIAIAEGIAGSVEEFVKMMNEMAVEMGAYNTSFRTPHGLDADGHYTTAEDLARITAYSMKNEIFSKIVSTKEISSGLSGDFNRTYSNINKFLYRIESADGVKTGYTGDAGKCLVASSKHENGRYICVILNSSDRFSDAEKLMKYADSNITFKLLENKGEPMKTIRVYGGMERYVSVETDRDIILPLYKDEEDKFEIEVYTPSVIFSPIEKGEVLGNLVVMKNDGIIARYPLVSDRTVKRKNFINIIRELMSS